MLSGTLLIFRCPFFPGPRLFVTQETEDSIQSLESESEESDNETKNEQQRYIPFINEDSGK
jgi:hypothetical protein